MKHRNKVLVADDLGAEGLAILERSADVTVQTGMDEDTLRATLPGYDALVVRSATTVTARSLEQADRLAVIGRAGIGIDNIDLAAATERGIVVMNTPDAGATTTGELAIALLVSMARNIPAADAALKSGRWDKKRFTGVELTGKTCGILGLGNIGRVVAALDVFEQEPLTEDHPLRSMANVVLTPHIGASTAEAKRNVSLDMAEQIATAMSKGIVLNGINVPRIAPSEAAAVGPTSTSPRTWPRCCHSRTRMRPSSRFGSRCKAASPPTRRDPSRSQHSPARSAVAANARSPPSMPNGSPRSSAFAFTLSRPLSSATS